MKKIFISHASTENNYIKSEIHALRDYLLKMLPNSVVILDDKHLKTSLVMDTFMEDEIYESCCSICICTPEYMIKSEKKDSGVSKELNLLLKLKSKKPKYSIYPLIFVGDLKSSVPDSLGHIYTDLVKGNLLPISNNNEVFIDFMAQFKEDFDLLIDNSEKFIASFDLVDLNPEIIRKKRVLGGIGYNYDFKDYQINFKILNKSNEYLELEILGLTDNYNDSKIQHFYNELLHEVKIIKNSNFSKDDALVSFPIMKTSELYKNFTVNPNPKPGYKDAYSFNFEYKINGQYFKNKYEIATRTADF